MNTFLRIFSCLVFSLPLTKAHATGDLEPKSAFKKLMDGFMAAKPAQLSDLPRAADFSKSTFKMKCVGAGQQVPTQLIPLVVGTFQYRNTTGEPGNGPLFPSPHPTIVTTVTFPLEREGDSPLDSDEKIADAIEELEFYLPTLSLSAEGELVLNTRSFDGGEELEFRKVLFRTNGSELFFHIIGYKQYYSEDKENELVTTPEGHAFGYCYTAAN